MGFNLTLSPLPFSPPANTRGPHCRLTCPHHRQRFCHIITHMDKQKVQGLHSTHCTQLPSCNCDLSGIVVKWCPMHMLLALLHYKSLGNDKTIYRSYLSTYPQWLELDGLTDRLINHSDCFLYFKDDVSPEERDLTDNVQ